MKLFLDTSGLLAGCGSSTGASRALFALAEDQRWELVSSPWVVNEVTRNLVKFPVEATDLWLRMRKRIQLVDDVVSLDWILVFPASKDRPVLLTALAQADVLLTLDRDDFVDVLGKEFYGLPILLPAEFLIMERAAGRLQK